jgi:hypothetical protein
MLRDNKIEAIGKYSNIPLVLAVFLFVISAFAIGGNPERSNDAAIYGYFLLAIGASMKFIRYIRKKEVEKPAEDDTVKE